MNRLVSLLEQQREERKSLARKRELLQYRRKKRFARLIQRYMEVPEVKQMDTFLQHGSTTTLEHCKNVAWISFLLNERLKLKAEEKELVEAALLHDFYLYDWHDKKKLCRPHGFEHPFIASENAGRILGCSDRTKASIRSHMWPLNITEIPKSRSAIIICLTDKYCAFLEAKPLEDCRNVGRRLSARLKCGPVSGLPKRTGGWKKRRAAL